MYDRVTYQIGRYRLVNEHIRGNYGAPGIKRGAKRKRTAEEVKAQNKSNRERKVQRLILANFHQGDYHLILTYQKDKRPESFEEGKKNLQRFLAALRKEYRKAGYELKWIAVTEQGERGAFHHHLIIENKGYIATKMVLNNITGKLETKECGTDMMVRLLWKFGRPQFSMLDDGDYRELANYITKNATKEDPGEEAPDPQKKTADQPKRRNMVHYSRSRNLIVPQPKRRKLHQKIRIGDPKIPKGYELLKGSLETGINPFSGYPWQRYTLIRMNPTRY